MKKIVLKIKHLNWAMKNSESWDNTEWIIYNDYSVEIKETYGTKFVETRKTTITERTFKKILNCLKKTQKNDHEINGCDGDVWEYKLYSDGKIIWEREPGYIYTIKTLEKIEQILLKLK